MALTKYSRQSTIHPEDVSTSRLGSLEGEPNPNEPGKERKGLKRNSGQRRPQETPSSRREQVGGTNILVVVLVPLCMSFWEGCMIEESQCGHKWCTMQLYFANKTSQEKVGACSK